MLIQSISHIEEATGEKQGQEGDFTEWASEVRRLAEARNAVILAHNYQVPWVQDVADHVGDSLALSRLAARSDAAQVGRGGRIRQLRRCWAASPASANLYESRDILDARLPRRRRASRTATGRCPRSGSRVAEGELTLARVRRLRAHAGPGHRRRLLPARLPAAHRPDRLGRDRARRREAARQGSRARARRGTVLRVPACRDQAGQAPGAGVPATAPGAHRPGALPARAGRLARPRYPRGLRGRLPRREHALHRLHGPTSGVIDYGAKALSAIASSSTRTANAARVAEIADPVGTFYRYSLPVSLLHRRVRPAIEEKRKRRRHEP